MFGITASGKVDGNVNDKTSSSQKKVTVKVK